ncbi:MAG: acyl-CoA dehydrogenase [Francisellaceae bacterium]
MILNLTDEEKCFHKELKDFLSRELTQDIVEESLKTTSVFADKNLALKWQSKLAKQGWAAQLWPEKYGGIKWTPIQKYLFEVECAKAGAPMLIPLGLKMVAPVIIKFGTEEQKERFLPNILSGDDYWCQGYSEPGSGSDLASLRCKAELKDGKFIVNGSKIWTTHAHYSNWMFCLVRTKNTPKPQAGISFLLIPMNSKGITVRPIISISGEHDLNEVFFEDVQVDAINLIGEQGQGWECAKYLLTLERGASVASARLRSTLIRINKLTETEQLDSKNKVNTSFYVKQKLNSLDARLCAFENTEFRLQKQINSGFDYGFEPSLLKTEATELEQALAELAVEVIGPRAQILVRDSLPQAWPSATSDDVDWALPRYLNSRSATIYAGTNEIQRNLIARSIFANT